MSFLEKIQQNILYFQRLVKQAVNFALNKGAHYKLVLRERIHFSIHKIHSFVKFSKNAMRRGLAATLLFIQAIPGYAQQLLSKSVRALVISANFIKTYSIKFYNYVLSVPARILKFLIAIKNLCVFGFKQGYDLFRKIPHYLSVFVKNLTASVKRLCKNALKAAIYYSKELLNFIKNIPSFVLRFIKDTINEIKQLCIDFAKALQSFARAAFAFIKNIPSFMLRFIKDVMNEIKQLCIDFAKALQDFARAAFAFIKNIPSYVLRFIKDTINEIKQLCQDFVKFMRNFASAMLVFIKNIPSFVLRFIKDMMNEIKQLCIDFVKALQKFARAAFAFVKNIPGFMLRFIKDMMIEIKQLCIDFVKAVLNFANATIQFVKNIPNYLATFCKEAWNTLKYACQELKKATIYLVNALKDFAIHTIEAFIVYVYQTIEQVILQASFMIGAAYALYSLSVEGLADATQWILMNGLGISISQAPLAEVITAGLSMGLLGVFTGALTYLSCKAAAFIYRQATVPSEEQVKQSTEVEKPIQAVYPSLMLGSATHPYLNQFRGKSLDKHLGESLPNVERHITKNNSLRLAV